MTSQSRCVQTLHFVYRVMHDWGQGRLQRHEGRSDVDGPGCNQSNMHELRGPQFGGAEEILASRHRRAKQLFILGESSSVCGSEKRR